MILVLSTLFNLELVVKLARHCHLRFCKSLGESDLVYVANFILTCKKIVGPNGLKFTLIFQLELVGHYAPPLANEKDGHFVSRCVRLGCEISKDQLFLLFGCYLAFYEKFKIWA